MHPRPGFRRIGFSLLCLGTLLGLSAAAGAATFTVLNTNDSGSDSLRAAITAANAAVGPHTIQFNIPGAGPHTIGLLTPLPDLVQTMTINGYSQPGSSPNTSPVNLGLNTVLRIGIDGSAAGAVSGLTLAAPDIGIRGLTIFGFAEAQILVEAPRAVIAGNFLGTNIAGTGNPSGLDGAGVAVSSGGDACLVGGNNAADRNLISGLVTGIDLQGPQATIRHNQIGTDITGNAALPNTDGIFCQVDDEIAEIDLNLISGNANFGVTAIGIGSGFCRLTRNYIGVDADTNVPLGNLVGIQVGPGPHEIGNDSGGNIISGNLQAGVGILDGNGTRLRGNLIGVSTLGSLVGNGGAGVLVQQSTDIQIGGSGSSDTNLLYYNGGSGVEIDGSSTGIQITRSTFVANGGLSIDLNQDGVTSNDPGDADGGANQGQNFPVIVATPVINGQTEVVMELDGAIPGTYRVQVYSNQLCDPSGFGEGEIHRVTADVIADANGDASFTIVLGADFTGSFLMATATDPNGNTSEFSRCTAVTRAVVDVPGLGVLGSCLLAACLVLLGLLQLRRAT